ncbi:MAG TPA: hypothetical protein VFN23_13370 [Ktedonobacteraceae bacterium]|nr:hypothetical protein [Ktedonobacteraceae bacterium]
MPICVICDDTGLRNSDSANPVFCMCAAGKGARRQWEQERAKTQASAPPRSASFIDINSLDEVNASVQAMRASLFGGPTETSQQSRQVIVQLLNQVAHPGHEITVHEATQLHDLASLLESFLDGMAQLGRMQKHTR